VLPAFLAAWLRFFIMLVFQGAYFGESVTDRQLFLLRDHAKFDYSNTFYRMHPVDATCRTDKASCQISVSGD